ncbi:MAG: HAD superfamily hydrolase (TIGR01484 family) [Parasphingorhabdus sp.]|jgi:HAD superfamily hydrolase (TIGR01484 family)
MLPLIDCPSSQLRQVRAVFTDIDDTLTTEGRLTADAYSAMANLYAAGIDVVPITGRPAGWCDLIARIWPVTGVVGENGAFYFHYDHIAKRMNRYYADSALVRANKREKLAILAEEIIAKVPGAAISADQSYRETDLAIDFAEDVPRLPDADIDRIVELFDANGVTAKVSSIHVNGWIGQYDKLTMTRTFATDCLGTDLDKQRDQFVFVGDSPNDAPMFEFFPNAIGVANVRQFENRLNSPPKYITVGTGGAGFAEVAQAIFTACGGVE